MNGWIDTRTAEPKEDGTYLGQMMGDYTTGMSYTVEGGWNTSRNSNGELSDDSKMDRTSVARWFDAPKPESIPKEWEKEWLRNAEERLKAE